MERPFLVLCASLTVHITVLYVGKKRVIADSVIKEKEANTCWNCLMSGQFSVYLFFVGIAFLCFPWF